MVSVKIRYEQGGSVEDAGLVGAISGFTYAPNIEAGFIDDQAGAGGFFGQLYPKEVKLSMEYTVFHTHGLGWFGKSKREPNFPYGSALASSETAQDALEDAMDELGDSAFDSIFE